MQLQGKTVVVTGGAGGLGRTIVERLLQAGATPCILDLRPEAVQAVIRELPGTRGLACDLADPASTAEAVRNLCAERPSIDALVNSVGLIANSPLVRFGPAGLERHDVALWRRVIESNLTTVFVATSCVVEQMIASRTKGVVVNLSSVVAEGNAGQSAYAAAKAGVDSLTATWAKELGPLGIRVAGLAPGYTETESTRASMTEAALKDVVARTPLRRLATPAEIAEGVLWILGNDFFHGRVLPLDGGLRM